MTFNFSRAYGVLAFVLAMAATHGVASPKGSSPSSSTQAVILGTGTPLADPDRSGPAFAIIVNGRAYLVDCGAGAVRRAAAAEKKNSIPALSPNKLNMVFITHLHSDHTLGYPDLIFTPWVLERAEPLEAYGPPGLQKMTDHLEKAWAEDVRLRLRGLEAANKTGYKVNVHELRLKNNHPPAANAPQLQHQEQTPQGAGSTAQVIYRDENVTVSAFPVKHGSWKYAYGYKFETKDRKIVISGDTAPTDEVVNACNGCDLLLHEVYSPKRKRIVESKAKQRYFHEFHTSPEELGEIARRAHPKLLVLVHQVLGEVPEQDLINEMKKAYAGDFVSAKDLDVY